MIEKKNFRDQVKSLLITKMRNGDLKPGQGLSLAALARELDVSVTPIREALTQLQHSKIIEGIPNRGFIIPKLSQKESRDLYQLVATLEALAMEHSSYDSKTISKLKQQQQKFENTKTPIDRINADIDFHAILTSKYSNAIALQILTDLKTRIFFYEMGFMNDLTFHENSEHHHQMLIKCIEDNNISEAILILKQNWMQILNYNTL